MEVLVKNCMNVFAWPTDSDFHRGYVDGLQGRDKRSRRGEEYEDGYACGTLDAAPGEDDRHVRAAIKLESFYGGDDLAAVSEGFEMGYEDALGHFAYGPPVRHVRFQDANLVDALLRNYRNGYATGMSVLNGQPNL